LRAEFQVGEWTEELGSKVAAAAAALAPVLSLRSHLNCLFSIQVREQWALIQGCGHVVPFARAALLRRFYAAFPLPVEEPRAAEIPGPMPECVMQLDSALRELEDAVSRARQAIPENSTEEELFREAFQAIRDAHSVLL